MIYILDHSTHPLLWFRAQKNTRLLKKQVKRASRGIDAVQKILEDDQ